MKLADQVRVLRQRALRGHQLPVPEYLRLPHLRPGRQRARVALLIIHLFDRRGRRLTRRRHVRDMIALPLCISSSTGRAR